MSDYSKTVKAVEHGHVQWLSNKHDKCSPEEIAVVHTAELYAHSSVKMYGCVRRMLPPQMKNNDGLCMCRAHTFNCPFCKTVYHARTRDSQCPKHGRMGLVNSIQCTFCHR